MMLQRKISIDTAENLELFGKSLSLICQERLVKSQPIEKALIINLQGNLGAGKTTLVRGFLRGFHYNGAVKSPTYTLVEPYELMNWQIYHFDLYRLHSVEELEAIGIRDYFVPGTICLIEWPELAKGLLPKPDLNIHITFSFEASGEAINGRELFLEAQSDFGDILLQKL